MDPNANLKEIERLLGIPGRRDDALEMASYLDDWIAAGGFEPDWTLCPKATAFFQSLQF